MKKVDKGGITYGKSHKEGGIPVKNASTGSMLEVEGGEGIVNKRSMASDKKVKMNGKEMTICEAVSQLNQMEGGVRFSCDDVEHRQFIEQMALGGELERGKRTEQEHIETLKKLYQRKITPIQATTLVAKEHIQEDPKYYSKLAKMKGKMADGGSVGEIRVGDNVVEYEKNKKYQSGYFEGKVKGTVLKFWNTMAQVDFGNNQIEWISVNNLKKVDSEQKSMGDGGMADNQQTHFYKMTKEEKRAHIAELKKNFVEKAKDGTMVKQGDAPVYPKMNKYAGFFDSMAKYQDEYKKAISAHEKTVTQGLKIKNDSSIPAKEKDVKLEDLRKELIADKEKLKTARKDLAKLPEMESPFYAPKLAEGGQLSNYSSFQNVKDGDSGSIDVKPIKDDVSVYHLPKGGFTINWKKESGLVELTCRIGKRSLPIISVLKPMFFVFYENIVKYYRKTFPEIDVEKSYVQFTFNNFENDPLTLITDFINALRYANNQSVFKDNYNPDTRSVYAKDGGDEQKEEQEDERTALQIIADAVSEDVYDLAEASHYSTFAMFRRLSNLSEEKQEQVASALVKWKKAHPVIDINYKPINELMYKAQDYISLENARMGLYLAFENSNSDFGKLLIDSLNNNLFDTGDIKRKQFLNEYKIFRQTRFAELWLGGTYVQSLLDAEGNTMQSIYFIYLLKK